MIEAEWRPDGNGHLARLHRVRIAKRGNPRPISRNVCTKHCQVAAGIGADHLGFQTGAIKKNHGQPVGTADDVEIGEDRAISGDDEPGPLTRRHHI